MRTAVFCILFCLPMSAQTTGRDNKKSLIEVGSFLNFSPAKVKQIPGFYAGYWYRYPIDETKTHLEIGGSFKYSTSIYNFDYGKGDLLYPIRSKEVILDLGMRMVKEYPFKNHKIEWVSELSFHNLFIDGNDIPDDKPVKNDDGNTHTIRIDTESVSALKIGQGIRFWKNNIGFGIQLSYIPYRLWYKTTVPEGFNSLSVEAGMNFRF